MKTARFGKNNVVSCILHLKKKRENETVSFLGGTISSSSSSPGRTTGEEKKNFLPLVSSSPSHVLCYNQNQTPPAPPHDE
jgi:hypothetical protein